MILNQENFLLKANNFKIKQCLPDFHIIVNQAEKEGLHGRPKGGMFIAIPEKYKEEVTTDVSPGHWRLQACILKLKQSNQVRERPKKKIWPKVRHVSLRGGAKISEGSCLT